MAKELQKQDTTKAVAQLEMNEDLISLLPRAESSDFEIPRITLIQPTSKIEGIAGDLICSDSGLKIAGMNDKFEFVPVSFFKDYAISEVESKKFRRNEPKSVDNSKHSIFDNRVTTDPDGVTVEYKERINLFVIPADAIDDEFPRLYRLILKPSSFKEARKFLSEWDIQIRSRLIPFSYLWSITPKEVRNEKGKFAVLEFQKVLEGKKQKQVTQEQLQSVANWVKLVNSNKEAVLKDTQGDDEEERQTGIAF